MEPFLAEIRIFPFSFPPRGWAFCSGQLIAISQNTTLFALLGVIYGGDGKVTFGLPNLQDSVPVAAGTSLDGTTYELGERAGAETVTLDQSTSPLHTHAVRAETIDPGDTRIPDPALNLAYQQVYSSATPNATLDPRALSPFPGGGQSHNNLMPYTVLNFCIALQGIYPRRTE